jgi:hypothetical protein
MKLGRGWGRKFAAKPVSQETIFSIVTPWTLNHSSWPGNAEACGWFSRLT